MTLQIEADLRAPGRVLLVSCYELGHPPHGISLPLAFLERAGFRPATLDLSVEHFDPVRVEAANLVCIATPMHAALRLGIEVAARIRALHPEAIVGFHGNYAALSAPLLQASGAAFALGGECEAALVEIAETLARGETLDPRRYLGAAPLYKLDFPLPNRATLPPIRCYAKLEVETAPGEWAHRPAAYVEATRGCRHHCRHCPIPALYDGRLFALPVATVLDDIRVQVLGGARHVTFGDADFLNAPAHSLRVVRALHAEFPDVSFDCTAKVEHLLRHRDLLPELVTCGARFVVSAIESLNDSVLQILEKGHTRADVVEVTRLLQEVGLPLRPSWLPFTPWSTLADFIDILDFVESEDLMHNVDLVQYSIRLLLPEGSLLLRRPELQPHLGGFDSDGLSYRWTHPDPRLDVLQAAVAELVGDAARQGTPVEATFAWLRHLAGAMAGKRPAVPGDAPSLRRTAAVSRRLRPPRLTEPWFC